MFVVAVESIFIFGLARWRVLSFLFFGTGKYCDGMGLFAYCVSMSVPCKLEKVCFWGGSCRKRSWSRFVEQVYACASKTFGLRFFSFTIILFSSRDIYDCDIPSVSATCFCVYSG